MISNSERYRMAKSNLKVDLMLKLIVMMLAFIVVKQRRQKSTITVLANSSREIKIYNMYKYVYVFKYLYLIFYQ